MSELTFETLLNSIRQLPKPVKLPSLLVMNKASWYKLRRMDRGNISYGRYFARHRCRFYFGIPVHLYDGMPDDRVYMLPPQDTLFKQLGFSPRIQIEDQFQWDRGATWTTRTRC